MPSSEYPPTPSPDYDRYENEVLDFIEEARNESESFLKAQPRFDRIAEARRAIHSSPGSSIQLGDPGVSSNRTAKVATQLVAGMTDTRPFWEFRTFNKNCEKTTQNLGKLSLHLWLQRQWDMRWADMIRGCCTGGTAYAHLTWDDMTQDLAFTAEDVKDVLPIRPAEYHTIQSAFGVILRRERTVNYMRAKYPEYARDFVPEREGSTTSGATDRYERVLDRLGSPFRAALFGQNKPSRDIPRIPTLDEFTVYLDDKRCNESRDVMYMGNWHLEPVDGCRQCIVDGTPHALDNWSYKVQPDEPVYPNKRLIIATRTKILYDNTSPFWHGLYPMPKLTLDPWDDTYIGKGLIWDVLPLQRFMDRILRLIDNHFQKWQQPDFTADKNSMSVTEFNKVNTARIGMKYRYNPVAGKGPEFHYPEPLPQYVFEMLKWVTDEISAISGAHDLSSVLTLNQLPSADSVERLTEAMTPEVRMRSRILEAFTREFAMITASNLMQFYTIGMRIAVLGPGGVVKEDFDYDPGTMVPDYIHATDFDETGHITADAMARGPLPKMNRAKEMMRQYEMHIAPGSLLSASEITEKLMYMTLFRDGIVDPQTLAEKMGIANWGTIPGDTIFEKLKWLALQGLGAGPREGRPPTAQQPPRPQPDASEGRIKVSESG